MKVGAQNIEASFPTPKATPVPFALIDESYDRPVNTSVVARVFRATIYITIEPKIIEFSL